MNNNNKLIILYRAISIEDSICLNNDMSNRYTKTETESRCYEWVNWRTVYGLSGTTLYITSNG